MSHNAYEKQLPKAQRKPKRVLPQQEEEGDNWVDAVCPLW